ncbi:putative ankyrin repeat-containing domain, PGG domain-containing protein [Medicago truncatula]|uniref:Putative ankyrin repeat-containing domain, PGG domain-containing protein n=1 Tax=Medicago truncatula TaxID=3880 RepID=A0A396IMQ1_MEDTR|nr:uncharacterized protein LOC25490640 [Medicago truncatula]RHN66909.1 putative ankyrin repeat-containing domain, PGG domain-containing protein [Medicago truncatula]
MASAYAESSPLISSDHVKAAVTEFARGFNHSYYLPLHLAILKGDWKSTRAFLDNDPSALTAKVTVYGRTALHVAAVGSQWIIVEMLLQRMPTNILTELDFMGCTCLHYVALSGKVDVAKKLVAKNSSVTQVTDFKGFTPLIYSLTSTRHRDMVWYLLTNTTDERPGCPFSGPSASQLVALLTASGFHDITMHLLQRYPGLATISDSNGSIILNVLSKLPSHFPSGNTYVPPTIFFYKHAPVELELLPNDPHSGKIISNLLQHFFAHWKSIRDAKLTHLSAVRLTEFVFSQASAMNDYQFYESFVSADIIFNATSSGIVEILSICFQFFPELVWTHIPNEGYLIQIAIKNRQEKVIRLLSEMPIICKLLVLAIDESNNTTSHLAARVCSNNKSTLGAALQVERDSQWLQEVEKLNHPFHKVVKNKNGKTAREVFIEEHKPMVEEGNNWIRDRSNGCMLVATLIATITFAAAITVPGGNNQEKGIPIFLLHKKFTVFIVSDAIAFYCSMASLMNLLPETKGPINEEGIQTELVIRLKLGLYYLLIALVATTIAFAAALSMLLEKRFKFSIVYISSLACLPLHYATSVLYPNLRRIKLLQSIAAFV